MSEKVTVAGKLGLPLEDGQPNAFMDLAQDFVFTQRINFEGVYDIATVDDVISFGTMATGGAKLVLVKSPSGGCTVKFNADTLAWPVPPGAYFLYANPSGGFITGMKVTTTGAAKVKILAVA